MYLSVRQYAEMTGYSPDTIRRKIHSRQINAERWFGGHWRIVVTEEPTPRERTGFLSEVIEQYARESPSARRVPVVPAALRTTGGRGCRNSKPAPPARRDIEGEE